jgi:hypothetical protein
VCNTISDPFPHHSNGRSNSHSAAIIALLDICVTIVVGLKAEIVAYLTAHLDIIALIKACGLVNVLVWLGINL